MSLKETIKDDMKAAFKAGDTVTRSTLSLLLSVIQNRELEKRTKLMKAGATSEAEVAEKSQLTDEEVVDAVSSEVKKRRDSVAQYESAGRAELAAGEKAEVDVLMRYMPEQMSEEAVVALIKEAITATGASSAKDIGKVMGQIAPKTKGKFDGARVSELVKKELGA
jgi:uncharacterized protein YqeY